MLRKIVKTDGFRIYFWPMLIAWLIFPVGLMLIFGKLEPNSNKEFAFVSLGTLIWLISLWIIVSRYERIKHKSIGKRCKVFLICLATIMFFGICFVWINELIEVMIQAISWN